MTHRWQSEVRDSELDSQGIVNNANYFIYYEHARHLYFKSLGAPFIDFLKDGYRVVLTKAEITYKQSLTSGNNFIVETHAHYRKVKLFVEQKIIRQQDQALISTATFHVASLHEPSGKLCLPPSVVAALDKKAV